MIGEKESLSIVLCITGVTVSAASELPVPSALRVIDMTNRQRAKGYYAVKGNSSTHAHAAAHVVTRTPHGARTGQVNTVTDHCANHGS